MTRTGHSQRGFGTIVMETMTGRSANGAVEIDYAPSGVTWRPTRPAANALEGPEREPVGKEELRREVYGACSHPVQPSAGPRARYGDTVGRTQNGKSGLDPGRGDWPI